MVIGVLKLSVTSNTRVLKKKFTSKNQLESGELEKTTVTSNLTLKPVVWLNYQNLVPYFILVIDIYDTNQSYK